MFCFLFLIYLSNSPGFLCSAFVYVFVQFCDQGVAFFTVVWFRGVVLQICFYKVYFSKVYAFFFTLHVFIECMYNFLRSPFFRMYIYVSLITLSFSGMYVSFIHCLFLECMYRLYTVCFQNVCILNTLSVSRMYVSFIHCLFLECMYPLYTGCFQNVCILNTLSVSRMYISFIHCLFLECMYP